MNKSLISPSFIAIQALGLKPEGTMVSPEKTSCAVCGCAIHKGDTVDELVLPDSFTNQASLAQPGGKYRCGACTAVMTRKEFQMGLSTAIMSPEGYFPIMRKEHRAWALLTPPKPPFAICIQTSQQQHVVWRAPVSLSKEIIFMRVGEQVVRIHRGRLLAAREATILLNRKYEEYAASVSKKKAGRPVDEKLESPFINDWKFQSASGGQWKPWVLKMLREEVIQPEELQPLTVLNGGEAWALNAVLHTEPVKPAPATI